MPCTVMGSFCLFCYTGQNQGQTNNMAKSHTRLTVVHKKLKLHKILFKLKLSKGKEHQYAKSSCNK